jgi:hypothetical protein
MSQPVTTPKPPRIVTSDNKASSSRAALIPSPDLAWKTLGRFGWLAVFAGLFDIALAWYPFQGGNPAWEFGIFNLTIWSLPLATTGLIVLLASGLALGNRRRVLGVAIGLLLLAMVILIVDLLYALVIPIALRGAPAETQLNIRRSIIKTVALGVAFPALYITLAVGALRQLRAAGRRGKVGV